MKSKGEKGKPAYFFWASSTQGPRIENLFPSIGTFMQLEVKTVRSEVTTESESETVGEDSKKAEPNDDIAQDDQRGSWSAWNWRRVPWTVFSFIWWSSCSQSTFTCFDAAKLDIIYRKPNDQLETTTCNPWHLMPPSSSPLEQPKPHMQVLALDSKQILYSYHSVCVVKIKCIVPVTKWSEVLSPNLSCSKSVTSTDPCSIKVSP